MEIKEKVQPHCAVCEVDFRKDDQVYTDTLFTQIFHADCFPYRVEFIKDKGTYEEIVKKYPRYKKAFVIQ